MSDRIQQIVDENYPATGPADRGGKVILKGAIAGVGPLIGLPLWGLGALLGLEMLTWAGVAILVVGLGFAAMILPVLWLLSRGEPERFAKARQAILEGAYSDVEVVRLTVAGSGVDLARTTKLHLLGQDGELLTLLVDEAEAEATAALLRSRAHRAR